MNNPNEQKYLGHFKMKKGGMIIIPGERDDLVLSKRDQILNHLDLVLSGGKKLKQKNIGKYFQALGGKYARNDICVNGNLDNCKRGRNISVGGAHKLLKLSSKKNFPMEKVLKTFKGSAPGLYDKLENKITGGTSADRLAELESIRMRKLENSLSKTCDPISMEQGRRLGWVGVNMDDQIIGADCDDTYKGPKEFLNILTKQTLSEREPTRYERENPDQGIIRSTSSSSSVKGHVNPGFLIEARRNSQSGGNISHLDQLRNEIGRTTFDIELNNLRNDINKIRLS